MQAVKPKRVRLVIEKRRGLARICLAADKPSTTHPFTRRTPFMRARHASRFIAVGVLLVTALALAGVIVRETLLDRAPPTIAPPYQRAAR